MVLLISNSALQAMLTNLAKAVMIGLYYQCLLQIVRIFIPSASQNGPTQSTQQLISIEGQVFHTMKRVTYGLGGEIIVSVSS